MEDKQSYTLKFRRVVESKPSYKASAEKQQNWKSNVFFAPKQDRKRAGRHHSTLADQPCNKTAQTILKPKAEELEKFAAGQKISNEEALKMLISECNRKWKLNANVDKVKASIPLLDAAAMIYNVNLSTNQYQTIRSICLPFNIHFPIRNEVDRMKARFHPPIFSQHLLI